MFVLQVIARMNVGGTAQYLAHLVNGLQENGLQTAIATGATQAGEVEDAVVDSLPIIRIPHLGRRISLINDLQARRALRKLISSKKPDIIHTHTFKAGLLVRSLKLDIPIVHTFHGHLLDDPEFAGLKRRLIIQIEKWLATRTWKLVTVGERVSADLLESNVGRSDQFLSIPPGVKPLQLIDKSVARNNLAIPADALVGGWLARFAPVKNPQEMLKIAHRFPNVTFVMGGAGPLLEDMKTQAPKNLILLGWVDAAEFLSAIDFLISTSYNEGMPVAFIEAQLAGLPVIATDVGSVAEVVEDNKSGLVVPLAELSDALSDFLDSESFRQKLVLNSKTSGARFSVENLVERHLTLYKSN